jgi:hypothetical protein
MQLKINQTLTSLRVKQRKLVTIDEYTKYGRSSQIKLVNKTYKNRKHTQK